ncbi:MAG: hypothetical protein LBS94_04495 [Prevotellaceae bacterium]|nr:hypothetical protein [Prevotellaceae bacterium]
MQVAFVNNKKIQKKNKFNKFIFSNLPLKSIAKMASMQIKNSALRKRVEHWEKECPDFSKWMSESEANGFPIRALDEVFIGGRKMKKAAIEKAVDRMALSDFVMKEIANKTLRDAVVHWGVEMPACLPFLKKMIPLFVFVSEFAGLETLDDKPLSDFAAGVAFAPFVQLQKDEQLKADMEKDCNEWMKPVFERIRARYDKGGELNKAVKASNEFLIKEKYEAEPVDIVIPDKYTVHALIKADDIIDFVNKDDWAPLVRTRDAIYRAEARYLQYRHELLNTTMSLSEEGRRETRRMGTDQKELATPPSKADNEDIYQFSSEIIARIHEFCISGKNTRSSTTISETTSLEDFSRAVTHADFGMLYKHSDTLKTKLRYIIHVLSFHASLIHAKDTKKWYKAAAASIGVKPTRLTASNLPEDWKEKADKLKKK